MMGGCHQHKVLYAIEPYKVLGRTWNDKREAMSKAWVKKTQEIGVLLERNENSGGDRKPENRVVDRSKKRSNALEKAHVLRKGAQMGAGYNVSRRRSDRLRGRF